MKKQLAQKKKSYAAAYSKGYGKRPLWQWVLIYVIIGSIIYGLIYFAIFAKKGYNYNYNSSSPSQGDSQNSNYQY
ncbi:MAG: hypothetical protein ABI425_02245 [Patescibacteria group bacterium]